MAQASERQKTLRQRVYTAQPTARVERLRQRYLDTKDRAVIDIGRIMTKVMKETEGEPIEIRRAKAFAATVRGVPINIYPDEPFVGWLFSEPRGTEVPLDQGYNGQVVEDARELDTLSTREYMPFLISDEDKRELKEEILPYWKAHRCSPPVPPQLERLGIGAIMGLWHIAHFSVNYRKVLEKGLLGVKRQAEERLAGLDLTDPEELKKVSFLQGVIMAMEAAAEIGGRFAARARELAEREEDGKRKAELLKIAEVCDRVPANPARTFYEALQSVWFTHMLLGWEVLFLGGTSPGRADQYLYPYYESDVKEGRVTKEAAQELVDCWVMRYSQHYHITPKNAASIAYTPGHHLSVGGLKADGSDASNELSFMFLEAMMHTPGMTEPTLSLLVHSKTPGDLLIKACQLTALGGGYPMFINHDLMVENLLDRHGGTSGGPPITLEIAREFGCCAGCHEPVLATMESGFGSGRAIETGRGRRASGPAAALEFVLTNGMGRIEHRKTGLKTGDPRQFKSFEQVREAYRKQVAWQVRIQSIVSDIADIATLQPTVFTSALTEDCIEKGIAKEKGGARYNVGAGAGLLGSVDTGNSLAAIKKLVFEEKKITMGELCDALDKNFEGYVEIRKMCLAAPKFGNDDDYVDEQVAWVTHIISEETKQYKNVYGGRKFSSQITQSTYIPAGLPVGALPSGRLAGEPLADGIGPTRGSDVKGPTAVLKSVGKVNNAEASLGQTLNMRIGTEAFEKEDGFKRLADLIRVFVDQKIDHVMINVVSSDTLRAAQREPDEHKDLTVKVGGYNARFVQLHRGLQDSIIARTEHGL